MDYKEIKRPGYNSIDQLQAGDLIVMEDKYGPTILLVCDTVRHGGLPALLDCDTRKCAGVGAWMLRDITTIYRVK